MKMWSAGAVTVSRGAYKWDKINLMLIHYKRRKYWTKKNINGKYAMMSLGKLSKNKKMIEVRSKIKNIEMAIINTLQLVARKNVIEMSSDIINYNSNCHCGLQFN
jgi:hypothetical protein